ncbi:hypothetical protein ACIP1U_18615 [Cupriavidus sp. NPDC089707]|uniref:hypothetical protein n=1 Tax=Cupriavidus sp. NPDC089707 TaxID=3363963 RepID=UPI00380A320A
MPAQLASRWHNQWDASTQHPKQETTDATVLLAYYGGSYVPAGMFVMPCGVISQIAVSFTKDRSGQPLDD